MKIAVGGKPKKKLEPEVSGFTVKPTEPEIKVKDTPIKDKNMAQLDRSWINIRWYHKLWRFKFSKDRLLLINMEMRNGFHRTFVVKEKDGDTKGGFKFRGSHYRFDEQMMYFNVSANMSCYDYHIDFALPFKRVFPLGEVNKAIESSGMVQTEVATNPSTLERFIISRIAEGVMKGQQIDEFFRQIRLLVIIILVEVTIFFLLYLQKSGVFQQLQGVV